MSKYGYNQLKSGYPELWVEDGYVHTGASGAVGSIVNFNQLNATNPVVRNSAGNYTLTLASNWNIIAVHPTLCSANAAAAVFAQVANVGTATVAGATVTTITLQFVNGSGTATDPPSGGGFSCLIVYSKSALVSNI